MEDDNNTASKLMNDEIREKIKAYYVANDIDEIIDYITNLQQELENKCWDEASIRADVLLEQQDYKSRCEKAIPMLKELNIKMKSILNIGIDIKEISDIEDTLNGRSDE